MTGQSARSGHEVLLATSYILRRFAADFERRAPRLLGLGEQFPSMLLRYARDIDAVEATVREATRLLASTLPAEGRESPR